MRIILLSGGSGKRLWPLSSQSRYKQFLKLLPSPEPGGEPISMVQRVWRQLSAEGLRHAAIVATGRGSADILASQLGEHVPLMVEPDNRDTFPAIALAATYLLSEAQASPEEAVIVFPVDSCVDSRFFTLAFELERTLVTSGADIVLLGARPTYPSEKYGYILPEPDGADRNPSSFLKVRRFIEKPPEDEAEKCIAAGALWNCGVFAFRLERMTGWLKERGLPGDYRDLKVMYQRLPSISFDREIVERCGSIAVIPYEGEWKDIGTWDQLTEVMPVSKFGPGVIQESTGTHLINELDIPIVVLGLDNAIVAACHAGILVADKSLTPKLKEYIPVQTRPMYEERRWGWYKVLDCQKHEDGTEVLTKKIRIYAGRNISYQLHHKRSETWTILRGSGEFVLDGHRSIVGRGDVLQIPARARHGIRAITDLELIEIQSGSELSEDDIIRIAMKWEDISDGGIPQEKKAEEL